MSRIRRSGVLAAVAIPFALAACDTVSGTYNALVGHSGGAGNVDTSLTSADDDLRRPPLTLPPDYNLRPPSSTSAGATDFTAAQQARQTVFGLDQDKASADAKAKHSGGASSGEAALLQRAGASAASPTIRKTVDNETNALKNQENNFTNNLLNPPADGSGGKSADGGWFSSIFGDTDKPTIER